MMEAEYGELVKENVLSREPVSLRWLVALTALTGAALLLAARLDAALPPARPLTAGADFSGHAAHAHLRNLTAVGPRVAGSYENEVWAVSTLVSALRQVAATASPHNVVELDRHAAAGAFSLSFFDGMNNVYRGVQSVVARVRAVGERAPQRQPALLLNCHFDTVPDSPGASDDGAGCAVMLELARALAAGSPLRRPVLFLFNGAEENIMQGSHAFVTSHRWAPSARAFLNLEACGAGGREVLFQAGPGEPWLIEQYAAAVPYPFASSLAQELFQSGMLPGDTDFRVFRDFGKLSGLDFAWSANGYVYHTALDTAERVPPAALQRTGDNVRALVTSLLSRPELELPRQPSASPPVYFDVLGLAVLVARPHVALVAALATVALVLLNVHAHASQARRQLYIARGAWWSAAGACAAWLAAGGAAGVLASASSAWACSAADARLAFYSRSWLLAPLGALPALAVAWALLLRWRRGAAAWARGWWAARLVREAGALLGASALLMAALLRLRSGFVPLPGALLAALADRAAIYLTHPDKRGDGRRASLWALGAALPALQSWYLLLALLATLAPIAGRAGTPPLPADVLVSALTGAVSLWTLSWLLPFVVVTRRARLLICSFVGLWALTLALVVAGPLYAPYSAERPQRLFLFHTRRTLHAPLHASPDALHELHEPSEPVHYDMFWVPEIDSNTRRTLAEMAAKIGIKLEEPGDECSRWVYCGAPYYLPVLGLVARGHWLPARDPPVATLHARLRLRQHNDSVADLHIDLTGPNHVVLIVSPVRGTRVQSLVAPPAAAALSPLPAADWRQQHRRTYFVALHDAKPDVSATWNITLTLVREDVAQAGHDGARWASLSLAGHALSASATVSRTHTRTHTRAHAALADVAPPHTALTGWGVHQHLYVV